MTDLRDHVVLGRTGLKVSRLGLGSSYGAPAEAYRRAFEQGVNYFYWGSLRKKAMGSVLRELAPSHRERLVIVVQSYARLGFAVKASTERAIKKLGIDYADVLLLGWFNSHPPARVIDAASALQERGLVRHVAISSHRRSMFPTLCDDPRYGVWHVRYNAVHRGAEREVFPSVRDLADADRPGVVSYTTTRWGHLCDPGKTPPGERTPTGTDCYRFTLTHPSVDIAMAGPDSNEHMDQALRALELGPMSDDELQWMHRVGDHIYERDVTTDIRD